MSHRTIIAFSLFFLLLFSGTPAFPADDAPKEGVFQTAVTRDMLDNPSFAQWVDGGESPVTHHKGVSAVLNTRHSECDYQGLEFGLSKNAGVRHVRIPLTEKVPVGTITVRGVGAVSVLRSDLPENTPADLANDALWIPGERISGRESTSLEDGVIRDDFTLWVFPQGTKTGAIRFTHTAKEADKTYAGWLGGMHISPVRVMNVAPYGLIFTSSENHHAHKIIDGTNNGIWGVWENGHGERVNPISAENPEYVSLIWEEPVTLRGLCSFWIGFAAADAQVYDGPAEIHPNESTDPAHWKTVASRDDMVNGYIPPLLPNFIDFGKSVSTRAVRLKITGVTREDHPHLNGNTKNGKRIWLGELMALTPLEDGQTRLAEALPRAAGTDHPPIPVRFSLPEDSLVTLVIEKPDGTRVRNLVSETPFKKGENVVYWDGSDDLQRDQEAAHHGLYNIPRRLVEPGDYAVRGLFRKPLELRYEFSVYNEGNPPWPTPDNTGGWLTNHSPPGCILWLSEGESPSGEPLLYIGSLVSEGGHGLAWFDVSPSETTITGETGYEFMLTKKGGVGWVGGLWTAAQFLARDPGKNPKSDISYYVGAGWDSDNDENGKKRVEIRLAMITKEGRTQVKLYKFVPGEYFDGKHWAEEFSGMAVHDGVAAICLVNMNRVVFMDTDGNVRDEISWPAPGGITVNENGEFFLLSGESLYRVTRDEMKNGAASRNPLVTGLDKPSSLTLDENGNIYISENGKSHHVRVFDKNGNFLRKIGKSGVPAAGDYDELHMHTPAGLAVDGENRLWVTECDFQPKRVSVWAPDGKLIRAFYGPAEYGGGGKLDPRDPSLFFYHGMEFRLDWEAGKYKLTRVHFRKDADKLGLPDGWGAQGTPDSPLYPAGDDRNASPRYFTNCHNNNPTGGTPLAMIWYDDPETKIARPVAAFGAIQNWDIFLKDEFRARVPEGVDLNGNRWNNQCRFFWSDLNGDGLMQPEEVTYEVGGVGGVTVDVSDGRLQVIASRAADRKISSDEKEEVAVRVYPEVGRKNNAPIFDFAVNKKVAVGVQVPRSSGGDQALYDAANDRTVVTLGLLPFSPESVCGSKNGVSLWSYPNPWPGLHASHESAAAQQPGQLIGITRLLGDFVQSTYPCPIFAMNGNQGNIYLMTSDGLFVAELFHDVRQAPAWAMPVAQRNMNVSGLTLHDENFWPSITQTKDGKVFVVDGAQTALVRVDGLDTLREIRPFSLKLSADDLKTAGAWLLESEQKRQRAIGQPTLRVPITGEAVTVDGNLDDWKNADWAIIDRSGVQAYFDSNSKPYDITAAACVTRDRLAVAFRTNQKDLLRNSGELPLALFKNGGCLDIMLGANADADPQRRNPVAGDSRLLITLVEGKPRAVLYRAVVPGTKDPVPFSSPWRTITLDSVEDITEKVEFAQGENGVYEIAVPLSVLGLSPKAGQKIKADLGILRGNGLSTIARVYWSNKATAITSDVPSEAELTPVLWGNWMFE